MKFTDYNLISSNAVCVMSYIIITQGVCSHTPWWVAEVECIFKFPAIAHASVAPNAHAHFGTGKGSSMLKEPF